MGKSSQLPWRCRHWIVKEGFRPGGGGRYIGGAKKNVSATPALCPSGSWGAPRIHACSYLQVWGAADGGVVRCAHPGVSGVYGVAKGWGVGESLPARLGRRACAGKRAGGELRPGHGQWGPISSALLHVAHGVILRVMAKVLGGDFLVLVLILLLFVSLGLRTSFFWNGENETPRASPGEGEAS